MLVVVDKERMSLPSGLVHPYYSTISPAYKIGQLENEDDGVKKSPGTDDCEVSQAGWGQNGTC